MLDLQQQSQLQAAQEVFSRAWNSKRKSRAISVLNELEPFARLCREIGTCQELTQMRTSQHDTAWMFTSCRLKHKEARKISYQYTISFKAAESIRQL